MNFQTAHTSKANFAFQVAIQAFKVLQGGQQQSIILAINNSPHTVALIYLRGNPMAPGAEEAGYVAIGLGVCINTQDVLPSWVYLQVFFYLLSVVLSFIDTVTDWIAVVQYDGANNSTLSDQVAPAWYTFVVFGTILTGITLSHNFLTSIVCSTRYSHRRRNNQMPIIDCDIFYMYGYNAVTRQEIISAVTLLLQDGPLIVFSYFAQDSCRNTTRNIAISLTAAVIATTWRTIRSFVNFSLSMVIRQCYCCPRVECTKCRPEKGSEVFPWSENTQDDPRFENEPEDCRRCCLRFADCSIWLFLLQLIAQVIGLLLAAGLAAATWGIYADSGNFTC